MIIFISIYVFMKIVKLLKFIIEIVKKSRSKIKLNRIIQKFI